MTVYQAKTLKNDYSLKIRVRQMLACLTFNYAPDNDHDIENIILKIKKIGN